KHCTEFWCRKNPPAVLDFGGAWLFEDVSHGKIFAVAICVPYPMCRLYFYCFRRLRSHPLLLGRHNRNSNATMRNRLLIIFLWCELSPANPAATHDQIILVKNGCLAGCDCALR